MNLTYTLTVPRWKQYLVARAFDLCVASFYLLDAALALLGLAADVSFDIRVRVQ